MSNDAKTTGTSNLPAPSGDRHLALVGQSINGLPAPRPYGMERELGTELYGVPGLRPKRNGVRLFLSFLLVVVFPIATAFYFLTEVASARYSSELRVAVRSTEAQVLTGMGDVLGLPGRSGASQDAQALVQYLQSRAIITDLEPTLDVRALFDRADVDYYSRLSPDATAEDVLQTWRRYVRPTFESSNNTVVIRVTTFSPEATLALSTALVVQSDQFVNHLSETARTDAVTFARREVNLAETRLSAARIALAQLQDRESVLDPNQEADAAGALLSRLSDQIASHRAILATQRSQLGPEAPSVRATEQIIAGLTSELDRIRGETVETTGEGATTRPLSEVLREFQGVSDEVEYAQRAYESAVSTFEAARIDADRRQIYLATVVAPALPEKPSFPEPLSGTLLVAGLALAIWLIGLVGVHAIKDHM